MESWLNSWVANKVKTVSQIIRVGKMKALSCVGIGMLPSDGRNCLRAFARFWFFRLGIVIMCLEALKGKIFKMEKGNKVLICKKHFNHRIINGKNCRTRFIVLKTPIVLALLFWLFTSKAIMPCFRDPLDCQGTTGLRRITRFMGYVFPKAALYFRDLTLFCFFGLGLSSDSFPCIKKPKNLKTGYFLRFYGLLWFKLI